MKKQRVKKLFIENLGKIPVIQIVCEKLDISRAVVYVWRKQDKEFSKAMDRALAEGEALVNDMSEAVILQRVKNGEYPASVFWLKHRHPKFKNKIEIDATIKPARDGLTPEQEATVKKALALAGLIEDQSGQHQSDGGDEKESIRSPKGDNQSSTSDEQPKQSKK